MIKTQISKRFRHRGIALTEMVIIMPIFLLLALGLIQWILNYQAKSTVNYAAIMAARAGAVNNLEQNAMLEGFLRGLVPLLGMPGVGQNPEDYYVALIGRLDDSRYAVRNNVQIRIMNPTVEAFQDHGRTNILAGVLQIPNDRLGKRGSNIGGASRVNIQDANLLKVRIEYCHKMVVPFARDVIARVSSWFTQNAFYNNTCYANQRVPILATAIVRMQSAARQNDWVLTKREVEERLLNALIPASGQGSVQNHRPWQALPTGGIKP